MAEINPDLSPIHLPEGTTEFEADGHTFRVEYGARLSVIRNRWLERYGLYSITGRDGRAIMAEVRKAYDTNNAGKIGDTAIILDNILRAIADVNARESPLLYICTLFINRDDEDSSEYDQEFAKTKIAQWGHIEAEFFFRSALYFLQITAEDLRTYTQISFSQSLPKMTLESLEPSDKS